MMTRQEIFTKVVTHLRKQGVKAVRDGECAYRGENGTMCAAGCLIADEHYKSFMEGTACNFCEPAAALEASGVSKSEHSLVSRLQRIHDCKPLTEWEDEFLNAAVDYKLELPQ